MQLRLLTMDDYNSIYALWSSTPGMGLRTLDDSNEGIERFLKRNPTTCFAALNDMESIIGVILCGHDGRRGYIYHMAVAPECRRLGIGTMLVDAALEALRQEGIHKAALVAFSTNEAGNRFWESIGFSERKDLVYRNKVIFLENH